MTKSSDSRKKRRSQRRFRVLPGGKKPQVAGPDGVPNEALEKTADGRFAVALNAFVQRYLREEMKRADHITQIEMSGVLMRTAAGIAVPEIGEESEQFVAAAETIYEQEYEKLKGKF